MPADVHAWLFAHPDAAVKVDLASQSITLPDGRIVEFPVDSFSKHCLLEGVDELGYILHQEAAIAHFEKLRDGSINTLLQTA
jgi:3-isopropylmalate/(R)-2-methylmalate dehydratase small subunit